MDHFAAHYDPLPIAVAVIDPASGRFAYLNVESALALGHDRACDLIGLSAYKIWPAAYADEWRSRVRRAAQSGALRELAQFANRWYDVRAWRECNELVVVASRDVTEIGRLHQIRLALAGHPLERLVCGAVQRPQYPIR